MSEKGDEIKKELRTNQEVMDAAVEKFIGIVNSAVKAKRTRTKREEKSPSEVLDERYDFLQAMIRELSIEYLPTTGLFRYAGSEYTPANIAHIILSAQEDKRGWNPAVAGAMLQIYINRRRQELVEQMRSKIMVYDPQVGDSEVRKFVALMTDRAPEDVDMLDVAAIQSFVWQVKRKFAGHLLCEHPLMPVFVGGQGFGKSWTLRTFLQPVEDWVSGPVQLKLLNNEFNTDAFYQYYVVPFEDLHQEREVNVSKLKSLITEPYFGYRPPHQRGVLKLPCNATCYATSNFSVNALLPDDSGARRWWEIKVPNRPWDNDRDGAKLRTIDFKRLWHSVDASSEENPRRPYLKQFQAIQQDKLRHVTPLEQFFEEETVESPGARLSQDDLYAAVVAWYEEQKARPPFKKVVREFAEKRGIHIIYPGGRPVFKDLMLVP